MPRRTEGLPGRPEHPQLGRRKNDSLFRAGHTPAGLYRQKLNIITNNIYGTDKDTLAVSTAMLRLWRSLAVDYDGAGPRTRCPTWT